MLRLLALLAASANPLHGGGPSGGVPVFPRRLDLFPSSAPGKNPFQGIPALVGAGDDTFVAVIQDTVFDARGTRLYSQLAARTSTSGGASWSPEAPLPPFDRPAAQLKGFSSSNPGLIYDRHTDSVIVHFTLGTHGEINETVQVMSTARPFTTWSEPRSLTTQLAPGLPPGVIAWPGPGHGIQLQAGPFAGRLLMSGWFWDSSAHPRNGRQNATVYYSDTHGESWRPTGVSLPCDESQLVELNKPSPGSIALYARHGQDNRSWPIPCLCQAVALSTTGGTSFGAVPWLPSVRFGGQAISYDPRLIAPGPNFGMESCVVRVNSTTLAFANSEGLKGGGGSLNRGQMTVRLSNSDGERWLPGVVVDAGPTSYCDIAAADGGGIALLWMARYHEYSNSPGNDFTVLRSDDDAGVARRKAARVAFNVSAGAFSLAVGDDATVQAIRVQGEDMLCDAGATAARRKLMVAEIGGVSVPATSVSVVDGTAISVTFGGVASAHARFRARDKWGVLEVLSVTGNVSTLTVLNLAVTAPKVARSVAAAYGDGESSSSVLILPTDMKIEVQGLATTSDGCVVLSAQAFAESGLNTGVGMWGGGGGVESLKRAIQDGEERFGLPSPQIGGEWAKASPALRKGYFLTSLDPSTLNQTVEYAVRSGMTYVAMLVGSWATTQGHYNVSEEKWGGLAGLRSAVRYMNSHGVKAGIHSLSANINTKDPYVTPKPDSRLAKRGGLTLAADVGAADTWLPLHEKPDWLPEMYGTLAPEAGVDMLVDAEILSYSVANKSAPYGLGGVRRGSYGTHAASHSAGATVYHLKRSGDGFLPDPDSSMLEEIASNLARSYNEIGAEMLYCDGLEHLDLTGHFSTAKFHKHVFERIKGDLLAESSTGGSHLWHMNARSGQTDWAATDSRTFMDKTKAASCEETALDLQGPDMGWWGYLTHKPGSYYATTPDEIEYMAARAVAYNANPNLETSIQSLMANGRTMEALDRMKPWWSLKLPAEIKQRLKQEGMDFRLGTNSSHALISPVKMHPPRVAEPDRPSSQSWQLEREFNASSLGVRVRTLSAVGASTGEGDGAIDCLRLKDGGIARTTVCKSTGSYVPAGPSLQSARQPVQNVSMRWSASASKLALNYSAPLNTSVGCLRQRFARPLDLSNNTALVATVHGDGSGALLNLELQAGEFYREYFVPINFVGPKEISLAVPETRKLFEHIGGNWQLPVGNDAKMAMRDFHWEEVLGINFFLTGVTAAQVAITSIEARRDYAATVQHATLSVGGVALACHPGGVALGIPVGLRGGGSHGDYLECEDITTPATCRTFDADGHALEAPRPTASCADALGAGTVSVGFGAAEPGGHRPRLEVTMVERSAEPLGPFRLGA